MLSDTTRWPENSITGSSPASKAEVKVIKEVLNLAQQPSKKDPDLFKELLERHDLLKAICIQARVRRFSTGWVHSSQVTSKEVRRGKMWWIKLAQTEDSKNQQFVGTSHKLKVVMNSKGIYECCGRLQGSFPNTYQLMCCLQRNLYSKHRLRTYVVVYF